MALTLTEIEAITNDYFAADGGKAVDIFFRPSFLLEYLLNQKKGILERPSGGHRIRVPLNYSDAEGGFFSRADPLSSDDRESINAAFFLWKHAYGNATIYLTDELENAGPEAEVSLVTQKLENAQSTCSNWLAKTLYAASGDTGPTLTGLQSMTMGATNSPYGGLAEDDLVASDGTKPWSAKSIQTAESMALATIQSMRSLAKIRDGADGKPNVGVTTEALYNKVSAIMQVQQRFTTDADTAKAGFTHLVYESMILAADDFCPAGALFTLNTKYLGFAVHEKAFFARQPWMDLDGPVGRSMKILWSGNLICSNRKAHAAHTNLS